MTTGGNLVQQCVGILRAILQSMSARTIQQFLNLPHGVDAVCEIFLPDRSGFRLCAFVRRGLRPATLPQLLERIEATATAGVCDQVVVFTDYVPAPLAEALRRQRVNFVDTTGNAYLAGPGQMSVFHTGNRPPRRPATRGQYFTESGAKILFFLLRNGPRIGATYRDMQSAVGVSLDKISKVLTELGNDKLLIARTRGDYEILDAETLLDRWVGAFAAKLERKILLGEYKAPTGDDFPALIDLMRAAKLPAVIGGEVAAGWLTDYLRPGALRLYIPEDAQEAVQKGLELAPALDGNIELCKAFAADLGQPIDEHGVLIAHPLIVYAELMAGDDVRLGETALRLKEQHLSWIA
ncbi:type IV toxin-antitoxin system AbiEi family antitoxin [Candidatus Bipolaricaulota bacterium]